MSEVTWAMPHLVQKLRDHFMPPQSGEVDYKYYTRTGECHQCGQCCSGIYLIHNEKIISTDDEFERLKVQHEDYHHFYPVDENEQGLLFRCRNLTAENTCSIHESRPMFCRKYPSETTLLFGGKLAPQCGFAFQAKVSFSKRLQEAATKKTLKPGKLLNDVTPQPTPSIPGGRSQ